jgi:hypothetical protein
LSVPAPLAPPLVMIINREFELLQLYIVI